MSHQWVGLNISEDLEQWSIMFQRTRQYSVLFFQSNWVIFRASEDVKSNWRQRDKGLLLESEPWVFLCHFVPTKWFINQLSLSCSSTLVFSGSDNRSYCRASSFYISNSRAFLRGTAGIILLSVVHSIWNSFLSCFRLLQVYSQVVSQWYW
jgi:hypothetical protein